MARIPGIPLTLGDGETYVIAPLTLGALEDYGDALNNVGELDKASIGTMIDVALASLKRNYPAITREQVRDLIDVGIMGDVFEACMDVSGLRRKELEAVQEAAAPGEAEGASA